MEKSVQWWKKEAARLDRKIAKLHKEAKGCETRAAKNYKQIAYLYKEIYKLERAIQETEQQQDVA